MPSAVASAIRARLDWTIFSIALAIGSEVLPVTPHELTNTVTEPSAAKKARRLRTRALHKLVLLTYVLFRLVVGFLGFGSDS